MTMSDAAKVATPECDKLHAVAPISQRIGEFVDWLRERGIVLAEASPEAWARREGWLVPTLTPIDRLLAGFFSVDLDAVEQEKRAIIDAIRQESKR